jgi:hypothetical protein
MTLERTKDFGAIKDAILNATFASVFPQVRDAYAYPADAVYAPLPSHFNEKDVLNVIDMYTSGNSGAIVGASAAEKTLIIPDSKLQELKANLRTGTRKKFLNADEMNNSLRR